MSQRCHERCLRPGAREPAVVFRINRHPAQPARGAMESAIALAKASPMPWLEDALLDVFTP